MRLVAVRYQDGHVQVFAFHNQAQATEFAEENAKSGLPCTTSQSLDLRRDCPGEHDPVLNVPMSRSTRILMRTDELATLVQICDTLCTLSDEAVEEVRLRCVIEREARAKTQP